MLHLLLATALAGAPVNVALPIHDARDLAWSGETLAVAGDGGVALFAPDGSPGPTFRARTPVSTVHLSGDGTRLVFADQRGHAVLADADGAVVRDWRVGRWGSVDMAISPSGERVILFAVGESTLYGPEGEVRLPGIVGGSGDGTFLSESVVLGRAMSGDLLRMPLDAPGQATHLVTLSGQGGVVKAVGERAYVQGWQPGAIERIEGGQSRFVDLPGITGVRAFAPHPTDGRLAYGVRAAGGGAVVVVYDPDGGRFQVPQLGPIEAVMDLAWSPEGGRLAVLTDERLIVVDVPDEPASGPIPGVAVDGLGFSPDGRSAWALYATGELFTTDLASGARTRTALVPLSTQDWQGPLMAPTPTGFVAHAADNSVATYGPDGARQAVILPRVLDLYQLQVAPDGAIALVGSGWIHVVDAAGAVVASGPFPVTGAVAPAPGGERVAYADYNGDVVVLDLREGRVVARLETHPVSFGFLPDGSLALVFTNGQVRLWRGEGLVAPEHSGVVAGELPDTRGAVFGGERLLLTGAGGDLVLQELPGGGWAGDIVHGWPWEYDQAYERLALHPARPLALTVNGTGAVQLWDMEARDLVATLGGPLPLALTVAAAPDGALWAAWADRGLGAVTAGETAQLEALSPDVLDLALSPDGARAAFALADGAVRVQDRVSGATILQVDPFAYVARQVVFSPDGQTLYAADDLGTLVRIDVGTAVVTPLANGAGRVYRTADGLRTWNGTTLGRFADGQWTATTPKGRRLLLSEAGAVCGDSLVVGPGRGSPVAFYRFDGDDARPQRIRGPAGASARAVACAGDRVALVDLDGVLRVYRLSDGAPLARLALGVAATDLIAVDPDTFVLSLVDGRVVRYTLPDDTLTRFVVDDGLRPGAISFTEEQP